VTATNGGVTYGGRRLGAAVVGAVSTTTLISPSPAAAAEPHNLSRQDSYTFRDGSGASLTCTIDGFNVLRGWGWGSQCLQQRRRECGRAHIDMTVSYIDTTGTPVTFDAGADGGFIGAQTNVASDLKVAYRVTLIQFW
jgi:hypothetical protein